jgi:hypothetical protein
LCNDTLETAVEIRTLEELQAPDEGALPFSSWGLGGKLDPHDAAIYQQETVAQVDLAPEVPESVRKLFERIRTVFSYGVLCYDLYTVADDLTHQTLEHAFRERFIEFYGGKVTFVDGNGAEHNVVATTFGKLHDLALTSHHLNRLKWRLRLRNSPEPLFFNGMLKTLVKWARAEGLLRGQRNRFRESSWVWLRNFVAHEAGYHLLMPPDAARSIVELAEIINLLWGTVTPGGRLNPGPVQREIMAVGWNAESGNVLQCRPELLASIPANHDPDQMTYVLVRAWSGDGELMHFDARYEVTNYPTNWLWGPGTREEATAWLESEQPPGDQADVLDRLFVMRHHQARLYVPQQLNVVAGLTEDEQSGFWYLVRADSPNDAFNHLRQLLSGTPTCAPLGQCEQCAVDTIGQGSWKKVLELLAASGTIVTPHPVPDVYVPSWRVRWNELYADGSWSVPAVR